MANTKAPKFQKNRNPITWLIRHAQMSLSSLGRLSRNPVATLMTAAVLGIAISLPSGLHLLIDNFRAMSSQWEGSSSISVFLEHDVSDKQSETLRKKLLLRKDISEAKLISKAQAMQEFRQFSGFGDALDLLSKNPLPAVILIKPSKISSGIEATARLAQALQKLKQVDIAQADLEWVQRLNAMTETIERGVLILAVLLSTAVLLIIGNTVRLEIQNRHTEIEIIKLVGGTDAFIRRPFLYEGIWYGLIGAAIALVLVLLALFLLQEPIDRLAGLYESTFSLSLLDSSTFLSILIGSPLLGLTGAWLTVNRHLSKINPE